MQKNGKRKWKVDFLTGKPYAGVAKKKIHFALQHGADVNVLDADGRNAAMVALARRSGKQCSLNPDNLRALIAAGLNTRQRDRHGKTLADYAEELIAKRRAPMNRLLEIREILTKQAG